MVPSDAEDRLLSFIESEIAVQSDGLATTSELLLSGAVGSLGVIQIVSWIEDEWGAALDPGELTVDNFSTVEAMVALSRSVTTTPSGGS